jgi:bifunctional non-homologous end joining protein LigD
VIDKVSGATKAEVFAYYEKAAARMLPYAGGRPIAIVRCPDGLKSACFFQKHWMQGLHKSVAKVSIGDDPDEQNYMQVTDPTDVLALAQFGMLELHVWGSKSEELEEPDTIVFDLDPGPDVSWKRVVAASLELREQLEDFGLAAWARVTGGKGVHVVVPIKPELGWDVVKSFTQEVARSMEKRDPRSYVSVMSKSKRGGRIFVDYLRNGRGSTAVTSYSLRARPGLPVAVPVFWEELAELSGAAVFTIRNVEERLSRRDPWAGFARSRRSLKRLLK